MTILALTSASSKNLNTWFRLTSLLLSISQMGPMFWSNPYPWDSQQPLGSFKVLEPSDIGPTKICKMQLLGVVVDLENMARQVHRGMGSP